MTIDDALDQLGKQMGITIRLDAVGACRLTFNDRFDVDIEVLDRAAGTVMVHALVGLVPQTGREALYETLLAGNLYGRGTGTCTLGVDPDMREVVLHRTLDMNKLAYHDFKAALEDFVTRVKAWTDRLAKAAGAGKPAAVGSDTSMLRI